MTMLHRRGLFGDATDRIRAIISRYFKLASQRTILANLGDRFFGSLPCRVGYSMPPKKTTEFDLHQFWPLPIPSPEMTIAMWQTTNPSRLRAINCDFQSSLVAHEALCTAMDGLDERF